jgi:putative serine protease PepD
VSTDNQVGPVTRDQGAAGSGDGGTASAPLPSPARPQPFSAEASFGHGTSGEDRTAPLPPVPPSPAPFGSEGVNPYATPQPGSPGGPDGPTWGAPVPAPTGPRRRGVGGMVAAVLAAALVAGGIGGGVGYWAAQRDDSASTTVSAPGNARDLSRSAGSVSAIAKRALPSVVTIEATGGQESGTGTGFVYDKQGHILTNNHVVAPAADGGQLTATFSDGKKYDAEVVGRAQGYDVAVIKLKGVSSDKLAPLALGNSDATAVGDATIAIGAPFGLSGTVTTGIVSAMHRPVASSDGSGTSSASYMSAIQTDASINPGNSGGPLLNSQGAVIGINSAIQPGGGGGEGAPQSGSVGLGFAIPINQAKRVAQELIRTGQPVYPVIKVAVDPNYQGEGAKIRNVTPGGPADDAGLKSGDVITKLDDTLVDSSPTLIAEIWQHEPGSKVQVTYTRDHTSHNTTLTLDSRAGDQ